jgi:DNA-binding CsgD family transcriptional regulator
MSPRLNSTEVYVLERTACGDTASAVARVLGCSVDGVKRHRRQLLAKLGASNMPSAVARGYELGLLGKHDVEPEPISDGQMRAFYAKCGELDAKDRLDRGDTAHRMLAQLAKKLGRPIDDARDLSAREAHDVLDQLAASLRGVA